MLVKTKAIVLSTLKFQEKSLIVKCFTESDGLKSYFVQNAYSNKKANQKIAYFQPLTMIEIEANHKNKGTLEHFKEIRLAHSYHSINTDIFKSTIVIFLSEILHHAIKEEEKNEQLFSFEYFHIFSTLILAVIEYLDDWKFIKGFSFKLKSISLIFSAC